jgi:hypothetical protein
VSDVRVRVIRMPTLFEFSNQRAKALLDIIKELSFGKTANASISNFIL